MRFCPPIRLVVGQKTFHALETAAEHSYHRIGPQMRQRIVNENIDRAGNDVIRGRTELPFFADDFVFAEAVKDSCTFGPVLELRARDFFQRRQILDELINGQRFARCEFFNRLSSG